jgi:hypothetical protein
MGPGADLAKKEGKGEATFGRDTKLMRKEFEAAPDDCAQLLHPVRYEQVFFFSPKFLLWFVFLSLRVASLASLNSV